MFHTWQNANLWPHFVRAIVQRHVDLLKESWVSVKTWIIKYCRRFLKKSISPVLLGLTSPLKRENSLQLKLVLNGDLLLMRKISLDYFFHHQGFVFTRADNNLFVTQPILHEINLSQHHVFVLLCDTLTTIKFIWEVEMHVGENFFQFNYQ